jgi:hypothetical protein
MIANGNVAGDDDVIILFFTTAQFSTLGTQVVRKIFAISDVIINRTVAFGQN